MIRDITIPALDCTCDVCGYRWVSPGTQPPGWCAKRACHSRIWNGKKLLSHRQEIKLPGPRKTGRPRTIALIDIHREEP